MPMVFLLLLIIAVIVVFIVGVLAYVLLKGSFKLLADLFKISPLPHTVTKSLQESRQYGREIMRLAQQYPPGPMRDRLTLTLKPVNEWLTSLNKLEKGLAQLYSQRNLPRELRQTTFEIEQLHRRLLLTDATETKYVRNLMDSKKHHLAALKELQAFQTQAELKIHKIASDLGRTHAEMLLIIAKGDFNENRLHRLDENLQEHLSSMRDMMAAMDEMGYSGVVAG
jgi:hypothetical protein